MTDALECSLDYLGRDITQISGNAIPEHFVPLLTEIEKLSQSDTTHVVAVIHTFIAKAKFQSIKG